MAEQDDYLVDMLVDLGLVNAEQVAKTRAEAQASSVGVVDLLLANKLIRPADVTQAKAAQFGAEVVQLAGMKIPDDVISIIPRHIAKKYRVVPVFKTDGKVAVAIADPSDLNTIDTLTHLLNAEIELRVASEPDIEAALEQVLRRGKTGIATRSLQGRIQELTRSEVEAILHRRGRRRGGGRGRAAHPAGESNHRGRLQDAGVGHSSGAAGETIPAALPH